MFFCQHHENRQKNMPNSIFSRRTNFSETKCLELDIKNVNLATLVIAPAVFLSCLGWFSLRRDCLLAAAADTALIVFYHFFMLDCYNYKIRLWSLHFRLSASIATYFQVFKLSGVYIFNRLQASFHCSTSRTKCCQKLFDVSRTFTQGSLLQFCNNLPTSISQTADNMKLPRFMAAKRTYGHSQSHPHCWPIFPHRMREGEELLWQSAPKGRLNVRENVSKNVSCTKWWKKM